MTTLIATAIFGVFMMLLGVVNIMGNIRSLHWYHRQRVLPEDIKPFGRVIGIGNILLGVSLIVFGILSFIDEMAAVPALTFIGAAILVAGVVCCLALNFYGMIKYNKGVF